MNQGNSPADTKYRPRIRQACRLALHDGWDRLGLLIAVSLTFLSFLCLPAAVGYWVHKPVWLKIALLFLFSTPLPALFTGACSQFHKMESGEEASWTGFLHDSVILFFPAVRLSIIHAAVDTSLGVNLVFYLSFLQKDPLVLLFIILWGYISLLWTLMSLYLFPLLALQEYGGFDEPDRAAKRGVLAAYRRAFYLAIGSIPYSIGALIASLFIILICLISKALIALLLIGALSLQLTIAARVQLAGYGIVSPPLTDGDPPENAPWLVKK